MGFQGFRWRHKWRKVLLRKIEGHRHSNRLRWCNTKSTAFGLLVPVPDARTGIRVSSTRQRANVFTKQSLQQQSSEPSRRVVSRLDIKQCAPRTGFPGPEAPLEGNSCRKQLPGDAG